MKNSIFLRYTLSLFLLISLLSPMAVLAGGDGKKYFNAGMKHEAAEEWDKAAEMFMLAVTENPKNPEYRLHLVRALFNASQMYMKKGRIAAEEKDYQSAYVAFRKAYAFDPVNELAKSEMARMVRLQEEVLKGESPEGRTDATGKVVLLPTGYTAPTPPQDIQVPQRMDKIRDLPFPSGIPLQNIVRDLATDLDLNVIFDQLSRLETRQVKIVLKSVTPAKALDYIFLQEGLFFQKIGPRTILVAENNRRTNFQQLVLRTFYLANASPKDVKTVIQTAIPAQPGRSQTIVLEDAATNSITVRDTEENIRLIGKLITSLDKDRAEVVMDVAIYEVNKSDLLRIGNQFGDQDSLVNLGGSTRGVLSAHGSDNLFRTGGTAAALIPQTFGVGLIVPAMSLMAFQNKQNSKLIASTQIHAFNNEDSSARIGQRVPVRTATFQTGATAGSSGVVSDVINYEQVGLTLKFKPIVFPNQDVQVNMEIESKDVAGASSLTPVFTDRSIKGTARVQNNKTLLLASVAQNVQSNGRQGLPLLGLIPILGRLFTAPTKDNRQVDVVIAITPRVIRAPAILPEDEIERPTGSLATPTSGSLEALIIEEERQELLAAARRVPNVARVQLPDQPKGPEYVRTDSAAAAKAAESQSVNTPTPVTANVSAPPIDLKPIDTSVKTLQIVETADKPKAEDSSQKSEDSSIPAPIDTPAAPKMEPVTPTAPTSVLTPKEEPAAVPTTPSPTAEISLSSTLTEMKAGEKMRVAINVKSSAAFRSAVLGLRFDEKKLAIRSVFFGDVFGSGTANTPASAFLNQNGRMYVSLTSAEGSIASTSGIFAVIEIEALADGKPEILFDKDVINFLSADGKSFSLALR